MKNLGKYFLAFVPKGFIQDSAHILKEKIKADFGVKY